MAEYSISDSVPKTGEYVCSSCGEISEFEGEDDFTVCSLCEDSDASWVPAVEEDEEDKEEEFGEE